MRAGGMCDIFVLKVEKCDYSHSADALVRQILSTAVCWKVVWDSPGLGLVWSGVSLIHRNEWRKKRSVALWSSLQIEVTTDSIKHSKSLLPQISLQMMWIKHIDVWLKTHEKSKTQCPSATIRHLHLWSFLKLLCNIFAKKEVFTFCWKN